MANERPQVLRLIRVEGLGLKGRLGASAFSLHAKLGNGLQNQLCSESLRSYGKNRRLKEVVSRIAMACCTENDRKLHRSHH